MKRFGGTWKKISAIAVVSALAFAVVIMVHAQDVAALREQVRARYDVVALQDALALVPHQAAQRGQSDIRLIEIRNGGVAINGVALSAQEARQRLGSDADLILRLTYLDAAAQREIARVNSGPAGNDNGTLSTEPPARTQPRKGSLVRFGDNITVGRDERIEGDVVCIGGSANVDGEVTQNLTVIGGSLDLGPDAVVHGNVAVVGGALNRSPGARVDGKVDNVGVGARFPFGRPFQRRPFRQISRVGGFFLTLSRIALLVLVAVVIVALGPRIVETVGERAAAEPWRSGLTGFVAELLFIPLVILTVVVLAVSIIGIPLLILVPFGIVLAVILMLIGFTAIAGRVGRWVAHRFHMTSGPHAMVALGVLVLAGLTLIGRIIGLALGLTGVVVGAPFTIAGFIAEYIAWTVGIGALILAWLGRHHRTAAAPPAAPAPLSPPPAPAGD
jgi:hypothetical protein